MRWASTKRVALLRRGLPIGQDAALGSLADRLGEWPLLLKLVNGALRDRIDRMRDTLPGALDYVERVLDRRGDSSIVRMAGTVGGATACVNVSTRGRAMRVFT